MPTLYASQFEVNLTEMPLFAGAPSTSLAAPSTCIICLDDTLTPTSPYRQLPCGHLFHQPCIDDWMCTGDTRCPLCSQTFYHLRRPRQQQQQKAENIGGRRGRRNNNHNQNSNNNSNSNSGNETGTDHKDDKHLNHVLMKLWRRGTRK